MIRIGVVPDPEASPHWIDFKAFLEPAAKRGEVDTLLGPHELLWAVLDDDTPIAAATARLTEESQCEIILCGGIGLNWAAPLADKIGACAAESGATLIRIIGRRGWGRVLGPEWKNMGVYEGQTVFERALG